MFKGYGQIGAWLLGTWKEQIASKSRKRLMKNTYEKPIHIQIVKYRMWTVESDEHIRQPMKTTPPNMEMQTDATNHSVQVRGLMNQQSTCVQI